MDNVFIDEIDFHTDIMPLLDDFDKLDEELRDIFNQGKQEYIKIRLKSPRFSGSIKYSDVSRIAKIIEKSVLYKKNLRYGFIDKNAFKDRTDVERINYRFETVLSQGGELVQLTIVPKYKEGNKLWRSMVRKVKTMF